MNDSSEISADYWDLIADDYQAQTRISCDDFHYGPLLPGEHELKLLPASVSGLRCLELGCGAGQNSIWLARNGACCTALDRSRRQLIHGQRLARKHGVEIRFAEADLGQLPFTAEPRFDLIHSAYALPFAEDQGLVIAQAARLLANDGLLVLSTAHPVFAGEWLEVDDNEDGIFLPDYFNPPPDQRDHEDGDVHVQCTALPISSVAKMLAANGLVITRLLEPQPLPLDQMSPDEANRRIPYDSARWRDVYPQLKRIPPVVIYVAARLRPWRPTETLAGD